MHFADASSDHSWQPEITVNTTTPSYWLNWRFLVCALWVLSSMIAASMILWKYEGPNSEREERPEPREETLGTLYADDSWRPCLKDIHPVWLLAYRIVAFFILLALLVVNVIVDGGSIFYFYTQWTFALVTIYFGLGSVISIYGYLHEPVGGTRLDAEHTPKYDENANACGTVKHNCFHQKHATREIAGIWGYVFQIIYQKLLPTVSSVWTSKNMFLNVEIMSTGGVRPVFFVAKAWIRPKRCVTHSMESFFGEQLC